MGKECSFQLWLIALILYLTLLSSCALNSKIESISDRLHDINLTLIEK